MDEFARILAIYRHGRLIRSKIVPPNENVEQSGFAAAGTAEQHHELSLIRSMSTPRRACTPFRPNDRPWSVLPHEKLCLTDGPAIIRSRTVSHSFLIPYIGNFFAGDNIEMCLLHQFHGQVVQVAASRSNAVPENNHFITQVPCSACRRLNPAFRGNAADENRADASAF